MTDMAMSGLTGLTNAINEGRSTSVNDASPPRPLANNEPKPRNGGPLSCAVDPESVQSRAVRDGCAWSEAVQDQLLNIAFAPEIELSNTPTSLSGYARK